MMENGLTPKAMKGPRPSHLLYIQSYAESPIDGESSSEWEPTDSESSAESESEDEGTEESRAPTVRKASCKPKSSTTKGKGKVTNAVEDAVVADAGEGEAEVQEEEKKNKKNKKHAKGKSDAQGSSNSSAASKAEKKKKKRKKKTKKSTRERA